MPNIPSISPRAIMSINAWNQVNTPLEIDIRPLIGFQHMPLSGIS